MMRKPLLSRGPFLVGLCLLSLAIFPGIGENSQPGAKRVPGLSDWTTRHLIYPRTGPIDKMIAAQRDPRAMMMWQRQLGRRGWRGGRGQAGSTSKGPHRDWSIYLGQNGVAPMMYPAKYSFDLTAAPSCTNDFVVYPIDAAGSAAQPNIVAFNNLYSGTTPAGLCAGTSANVYWSYNVQGIPGGGAVTTSPELSFDQNGTGTGKKVAFVESGSGAAHFHVLAWNAGDGRQAGNLQAVGLGQIVTATVASGGTKYHTGDTGAIIQNGNQTGTYRVASHSGPGNNGPVATITITAVGTGYTAGGPLSTTTSRAGAGGLTVDITTQAPVTINTFVTTTPAIGTGTATATDLPFGSSTDTLSSPYIDYGADTAYVGNDVGQLYRIKDVFCMGINGVNHDCASESSGPSPSIDTTWGAGGFVQVCGGVLTSPTVDFATGTVFVGCSDGNLYGVTQQGQVSSVQVGTGGTHGGIVATPMVDDIDGFVYAVSGAGSASGGASGVLVQASDKNLGSFAAVPIGTGGQCDAEEPTVNNAYLNSITSAGALIYVTGVSGTVAGCAPNSGNTTTPPSIMVYGVALTATGTVAAGVPKWSESLGGGPGYQWAPLMEFYNPATATDWLFFGALEDQQSPSGNLGSVNIGTSFMNGGVGLTVVQEGMGPTGMIVDNDSSSGQASSIYFGATRENTTCNVTTVTTNTGGCAVKLTQNGLQ
ncbi:MAG: hypothetical protein ACRD8A_16885 [Candidatus Acidiferrales bacterium]